MSSSTGDLAAQQRAYILQTMGRLAREYMGHRVAHMHRANPSLRGVVDDLIHQLNENVAHTLSGNKAFGPIRYQIADIIFSDDHDKRRALLTPTDQNTLVNEIIEKADDQHSAKTASATALASLRSLYGHFDGKLEIIVETLQNFQWIDLPDVFDVACLEASRGYIGQILKAQSLPDPLRQCVNMSLNRGVNEDLGLDQALLLFYHRMKHNLATFQDRRRLEPPYTVMLRREAAPAANDEIANLILACATHINNGRQIQQAGGQLSSEQQAALAQMMGCAPEQATAERALAFEGAKLAEKRKALAEKLALAGAGGQVVNHKQQQLAEWRQNFDGLGQTLQKAGLDLSKDPPKAKPREDVG